jgi:hypothetical protein
MTYEESLKIIKNIQENKLTEQELMGYLCSENTPIYILSNTIIQLCILKIETQEIVQELEKITKRMSSKDEYGAGMKVGHLAIAALGVINTDEAKKKYNKAHTLLEESEQARIIGLIEMIKGIIKEK